MNLCILAVVLLFGAATSVASFWRMRGGFGPYNLRAAMLPLVVTLTVLLALVDKASDDAAIGILGATVGYLFGLKESRKRNHSGQPDQAP